MDKKSLKLWVSLITVSLLGHFSVLLVLDNSKLWRTEKKKEPVKISIVTKPKPELPKPIPEKPKPKKIVKKKKPKKIVKKAKILRKPKKKLDKVVQPIQGLTKDSFVKDGKSSFQAPVGNSLAVSDKGIRKKEVDELQEDQSSNAKLIKRYFEYPQYTDDALDAGLEGQYLIDVFVDENGVVLEVELRKKIGYGMDKRLLKSIEIAKFIPRKNSMGLSIKGWAIVKINLTIP